MKRTASHFSHRLFYTLLALIMFAGVSYIVYSYVNPIPNPGHGADTVWIAVNGQEMTLQQAINAGTLGSSGGSSASSSMKSLPGTIEITGWDGSGSSETCWYRIWIDGEPLLPPTASGSSQTSTNLDEIDNDRCHRFLRHILRTRGLSRISEMVGRPILWYNITDYTKTPNAAGIGGVNDATFTLQYIGVSSIDGKPIPMKCPNSCIDYDSNGGGNQCFPPNPAKVTTFAPCCGSTCFPDLI